MNKKDEAKFLVLRMTLKAKASLCVGKDFWHIRQIKRLGLPSIMVADGPYGLRKQKARASRPGLIESLPATCFPASCATACSFDRALMQEIGGAIADECRQENVSVLLGPGINIKRSPLCGRNFEYVSEDPCLSGEMGAAFITGVQSRNVGVSLKHFAANNQETRRLTSESVIDERAMRELYLEGFERAVKKAKPWTVMCSYNKIYGEFASDSKHLLTDILRNEWGFDGIVISDWGATNDRVKGIAAGLDLEMPGVGRYSVKQIIRAVKKGRLDETDLDACTQRIVELVLKAQERQPFAFDAQKHHLLARHAVACSAVLLKNEDNILPGKRTDRAAVIGAFAKTPRFQGAGSSRIEPLKIDNAFDELKELGLDAEYAPGYEIEADEPDEQLIKQAMETAKGKDIVYLFAGLPDRYESEGFDRSDIFMPPAHVELIRAVCAANKNTVVILSGGSVIDLSWQDCPKGILMGYLGGQSGAGGIADLLLGIVNPSGKLAESWPNKFEDNPSHSYFPGYQKSVEYRESIFVGYRYYDTAKKEVRFPFGHGLSYTTYEYSGLTLSQTELSDDDTLNISCSIRNIGQVDGAEIVQLYVSHKNPFVFKAEKELKGFEKVFLKAGEQKEVSFALSKRDFAYYNTIAADWCVESGIYEIKIAASSRDIRLSETVTIHSENNLPAQTLKESAPCYYDLSDSINVSEQEFAALYGKPLPARERDPLAPHTAVSTISDIQNRALGRFLYRIMKSAAGKMMGDAENTKLILEHMLGDMPLRFLTMSGISIINRGVVDVLVNLLNGHFFRGILSIFGIKWKK